MRYQFEQHSPHTLDRPFQREDRLADPLYVITTISNPIRWRSRWKLFADFRKMVAEAGAVLYTVEIAYGDRDFVVTSPGNPRDVQLRTWSEIWNKESGTNLGVSRLPSDWKKVAWIDADCHFARYDWADETKHALEHWPIVQMWSQLHLLDSDHQFHDDKNDGRWQINSYAHHWLRGDKKGPYYCFPSDGGPPRITPGAPGLAWATRREVWDQLGGLLDCCIMGAADSYMACALTGELEGSLRRNLSPGYKQAVLTWQQRTRDAKWHERSVYQNIGVVKGLVLHYWHGPIADRRYSVREDTLIKHQFDPYMDLKKDWQGLYQLTDRKPQLRRDIQAYFRQRNEDAS